MRYAAALMIGLFAATSILAQNAVLENDALRLTLSPDGKIASIVDKRSGKEYAVPYPIASAVKDGKRTSARALRVAGDAIDITFGSFGIQARLAVEKHPVYFAFRLEKVEGNPEEITFFQVRTIAPERAVWGNILWFEDFCLGFVEGEPETRTRYGGGKNGGLYAMAYTDPGIKNNRVALYGCPRANIGKVIGRIEKAYGLPGGIDVKSNEANRRSYVMGRVGAADVDRLIDYAGRGGFGSILMTVNSWGSYGQKYAVPERYWPGGLPELKAAVDRIHAAGLKAGAHMFASKVPKYGDYTSPVPDRRIHKDCVAILAEDLDEKADRIVTKEPPTGWPRLPGTRDIHIDDELIT